MTCLSIVQSVCKRVGINSPNAAVTSADQQVLQIVELCNEEGQELASRATWQALIDEGTFTTLAQEDQGALSSIAPGLKFIINDTIWNRTLNRPVFGPLSAQRWQQNKSSDLTGPYPSYRIRGDRLLFNPEPTAGDTCYLEYVSKNWVESSSVGYDSWQADTDTTLLDEQLIILGTIWRWKAAKGFEYAEDFNKYEKRVLDSIGRDGVKPILSMNGARYDIDPFIIVSSGNWPL
jgi:hypothetical protein